MSVQPNFLIIGAARCGTTALAQYLGQHPDVFFCSPKEPHFLSFANRELSFQGPGDDVMMNQTVVTDPNVYFRLFEKGAGHQAIGEGSVSTLYYYERSIEAIQQFAPNAKLVVMLRNPIERCYSNFLYTASRGFEPEANFLAALDDEERRAQCNWHHLWHYTRMGFYLASLQAFQHAFGADRIKVILFDDFENDSAAVMTQLHRFLVIDTTFKSDTSMVVNRSGTARRWPVKFVMQLAHRQPIVKNALKAVVPFAMRERIRNSSLAKPPMPPGAFERLSNTYVDEIRGLGDYLQRDLSCWLVDK